MARTAIVTGADSGIGKATAVVLAQQGYDVGITWHEDKEGADGTAQEISAAGQQVELAQVDLTELPQAAKVVDDLADALGRVDVLVNNAGVGHSSPFLEHEFDQW